MNLSARDLRALLSLIEEGSFTRAARRVHLSQPAFSALIQQLEDSLGARLFDRTTRHVAPTPECRLLEPAARRLLADLEGMLGDFRDHAQKRKGRVRVAVLPSLAAGWLPQVLAEFGQRYPGIEFSLMDTLADECKALVRGGQVDFAAATWSSGDQDLLSEPLCSDAFHLVCPAGHPLARKRKLTLADLAAYPFVHLSRDSSVRQHLDAAFHPTQMRTVAEVEHLATVTGMVAAGLGITVVPGLTLFQFDSQELTVRPLEFLHLRRELVLLRRKDESLPAGAQALYELMARRKPAAGARHPRKPGGSRVAK